MNIFSRDYIIRKGSTFSKIILLEDIYVTLDSGTTYTVEGGMELVADSAVKFAITGALSENNTKITISMTPGETTAVTVLGNYNYAIDIASAGVVQTILEGSLLLKDDVSKTT
jgi:hypothetical protein